MEVSALFSVIVINIILSGDNALAIALASRNLPPKSQHIAVIGGSIIAVGLQIILTFTASILLTIPYLRIIGGIVLIYIAAKLLIAEHPEIVEQIQNCDLLPAIFKITLANLVMSLDNVLAVAAVSQGNVTVLSLGLLASCPVIIGGSTVIVALLEKFPIITWLGGIFLAWSAGGIIAADTTVAYYLAVFDLTHVHLSVFIALLTLAYGFIKNKLQPTGNNEN